MRGILFVAIASAAFGGVAYAAGFSVDQIGQVFTQSSFALSKGDRMIFYNHDDVTHNISIYDEAGDGVDLGLQKPGVTINYRFDKDGKFVVRCSIHPTMKMTVTVK